MKNNAAAANTTTFNFMGAFTALIERADPARKGRHFPEIQMACIDRGAVVDLADEPGSVARVERLLDSAEAVALRYGWSVDLVMETLRLY